FQNEKRRWVYLDLWIVIAIVCAIIYTALWLVHFLKVDALLFVVGGLFLVFLYGVVKVAGSRSIRFMRDRDGKIDILQLGMLGQLIQPGMLMGMAALLTTGMAIQLPLVQFTANHLDLPK